MCFHSRRLAFLGLPNPQVIAGDKESNVCGQVIKISNLQ